VLPGRENLRAEIGLSQFFHVHFQAPFRQQFNGAGELFLGGFLFCRWV
jgi:hypothetical protein